MSFSSAALYRQPGLYERAAYVLLFSLLVLSRLFNVAITGRVWAEEGTIFMRNAMILPWHEALLHPIGGYLNIVANISGIISANVVQVEYVRYVGIVVGLLFQTLPAVLIVTSDMEVFRSRLNQLTALMLVGVAPLAVEVWLNFLHPQFHLALCASLILVMPARGGWKGALCLLLLILGSLSGPTVWFLLPLFVLRALLDRSGPRALQAGALLACVVLQTVCFYSGKETGGSPATVHVLAYAVLVKNLLIPLLGGEIVRDIAKALAVMCKNDPMPLATSGLFIAVLLSAAYALWRFASREAFWFYAAAMAIALPSYYAARGGSMGLIDMLGGNRYAFVPNVLTALCMLAVASRSTGAGRHVLRGLVVWLVLAGLWGMYVDRRHMGFFVEGPDWVAEVKAWRADSSHKVRIWPNGWTMNLNPPPPGTPPERL